MCTLFGALPGESLVTGANYVKVGYGLDVADIWRRNLLVLFGFMILFQITQVVLIELFPHFDGGSAITIFAPEDGETKKLNDTLRERKTRKAQEKAARRGAIDEKSDLNDEG